MEFLLKNYHKVNLRVFLDSEALLLLYIQSWWKLYQNIKYTFFKSFCFPTYHCKSFHQTLEQPYCKQVGDAWLCKQSQNNQIIQFGQEQHNEELQKLIFNLIKNVGLLYSMCAHQRLQSHECYICLWIYLLHSPMVVFFFVLLLPTDFLNKCY